MRAVLLAAAVCVGVGYAWIHYPMRYEMMGQPSAWWTWQYVQDREKTTMGKRLR